MKKLFLLLIFACFIFSCSNETNDTINSKIEQENVSSEQMQRGFLCGSGYHLEWELVDTPIRLFKKSGCSSGFGLCFEAGAVWSFDCVRDPVPELVDVAPRVSFTLTNNLINSVAIGNENTKMIKFYFSKHIVGSTDNIPVHFNVFDVDNDVYISDHYKLVSGIYNKVVEGDFFTYTVPFTYEP